MSDWQGSSLEADHSHHLAEVHFENHAPQPASSNDVTYQLLSFKIRKIKIKHSSSLSICAKVQLGTARDS
jgi:hypothetical protein